MNVLIIPEDFRYDQYILKPIVTALLAAAGKPHANVRVMMDPLLGGISQATSLKTLTEEVLPRYRTIHLFLLLVDRDAQAGRRAQLLALEQQICFLLGENRCFLAEAAYEEIEVWALAGAQNPGAAWAEIRSEQHPKELYFETLVAHLQLDDEPGEGRDTLGQQAAAAIRRVRQLCPELDHLYSRIQNFATGGGCIHGPFLP